MSIRNLYILFFVSFVYSLSAQGWNISVVKYLPHCNISDIKINVSGNTPPYNFAWSKGMTGDSVSNLGDGVFAVHITDSNNKDTTVAFILSQQCQVAGENVFTPNGDGFNDTWFIKNIEKYPNFSFQVYNRWGQTVHTQKHEYINWDGTQLGLKVPDATYYYVFFYDEHDNTRFEKGSVTIVR